MRIMRRGDKVVNLFLVDKGSNFFRYGLLLQSSMCFATGTSYCMHYKLKKKGVIEKIVMKRVTRK
jgi:hypothetical protein